MFAIRIKDALVALSSGVLMGVGLFTVSVGVHDGMYPTEDSVVVYTDCGPGSRCNMGIWDVDLSKLWTRR